MSIWVGLTCQSWEDQQTTFCILREKGFLHEEAIVHVTPGGGSTIDMKSISNQHLTVHMDCLSLIFDPGGRGAGLG